jgi:hypothetical protein
VLDFSTRQHRGRLGNGLPAAGLSRTSTVFAVFRAPEFGHIVNRFDSPCADSASTHPQSGSAILNREFRSFPASRREGMTCAC